MDRFRLKLGVIQENAIQDNAMGEPSPDTTTFEKPSEPRLDSWKEIAAYLGRDVTTVQRWEKREAMPVHRHVHDKRGSVYALAPELDAWLKSRRQRAGDDQDDTEKEQVLETPVETQADHGRGATLRARTWIALAGVAVLGLLSRVSLALFQRDCQRPQPVRDKTYPVWSFRLIRRPRPMLDLLLDRCLPP